MRLKEHSTEQKLRGAYYTPKNLAAAIVSLCPCKPSMRVLEPSCGDGVFIEALRDGGLLGSGVQLDAVEIDQKAIDAARAIKRGAATFHFVNDDFFKFYEKVEEGSYDLVLGNPPYIRYQYMFSDQRTLLADILASQGMRANKLVNAWVGFMVACTNLLADGGTLAFVIPAEIMQVVYAEDLRHFLAKHYTHITLLSFSQLVFDDIKQETVVFIGKKGKGNSFIRIIESSNVDSLVLHEVSKVAYQPFATLDTKWTRYFVNADDAKVLAKLQDDARLVAFSEIALINVGVTTGNNSYFSITDDISSRYNLDEYTLPLIGRSSHASGVYFTEDDWELNRSKGKRSRLLVFPEGSYEKLDEWQRAYIDEGWSSGAGNGYKCSIRDSWYSIPSVWIPDAFFLRRNNLYPKFVINGCGAISTDTMHRMKLRNGLDQKVALICYYNSISFAYTELCGRSYGGGVLEILPKEVGNVLVLNPDQINLSNKQIDEAVSVADRVIREGRNINEVLDYIDQAVLIDVLGFEREVCSACRRAWRTLQARRIGRGNGKVAL